MSHLRYLPRVVNSEAQTTVWRRSDYYIDTNLLLNNSNPEECRRKCYFPINHVGSDSGSSIHVSPRRLYGDTARAIVGGLRRISKATANARDAVAGFTLPALPFSLLVHDSYGVKNTRLTIRRLPRSFVILANYPVRARTQRPTILMQV